MFCCFGNFISLPLLQWEISDYILPLIFSSHWLYRWLAMQEMCREKHRSLCACRLALFFCSVFNFDTILLWYGSRERTPYGVSCKLRLSLKFLLYLKCQSLFEAFVLEHDMFPESLCSVFWIKSWQKCHTEKWPSGYLHPFNHPQETWGTYHWWYKRCVLTFQPYWV